MQVNLLGAGPLQRACKLAVKTVAPFFTLPEKLPKTTLLPLGRVKTTG